MNGSFFNPGNRGTAMPTGAQGVMPRRSSYAAIVSGAASVSSSAQQQTPAFSQWASHMPWSQAGNYFDDDGDMDFRHDDASGAWRGSEDKRQLPHYSRAFQPLVDSARSIENINSFFIPSYLRGSKYAKKLEAAHRAKAAVKKNHSKDLSSTSASRAEFVKPHLCDGTYISTYNGVALELVEKTPPINPDEPEPLPTKMNVNDKDKDVEVLADGLEIKFLTATGKLPATGPELRAFSIRGDATIPMECGIYYFEVEVLTKNATENSPISIGIATAESALARPIGWEKGVFAYHGDDGHTFDPKHHGVPYGPEYGKKGEVVGCGINFTNGEIWFTKDGGELKTAYTAKKELQGKHFPAIGLKRPGEHVRVNFGQIPFLYDIDRRFTLEYRIKRNGQTEKAKIAKEIEATKTDNLAPPLDETSLIQSLVLQYLAHDGYSDTAEAFAQEVQAERKALSIDPKQTPRPFEFTQNNDASFRNQIRNSILDGDIETALRITKEHFPKVLVDNRKTYFHLRVRQFIEMVKRDADLQSGRGKDREVRGRDRALNPVANADDWLSDTIQQEMELDPPAQNDNDADFYDRMETDEAHSNGSTNNAGTNSNCANGASAQDAVDAIQFGKDVKREFQLDTDREMQKELEDAFALLSYEDPAAWPDVSWMLRQGKRVEVADELNGAILVSLGKAPAPALDRLIQQTTVLIDMLAHQKPTTTSATLVNVQDYLKPEAPPKNFDV